MAPEIGVTVEYSDQFHNWSELVSLALLNGLGPNLLPIGHRIWIEYNKIWEVMYLAFIQTLETHKM